MFTKVLTAAKQQPSTHLSSFMTITKKELKQVSKQANKQLNQPTDDPENQSTVECESSERSV